MMALGKKHVLAVFDFDHTLINLNTDVEVQKLSPGGRLPEDRFGTLQETLNWQEFMQQVFNHLHENLVSSEEIRQFIRTLEFTSGAAEMLRALKEDMDADVIIISDSNTLFIDELLDASGLAKYIDKVFTHPTVVEGTDRLVIEQLNPGVDCSLRPGHMCKGHILDKWVKEKGGYDVIAYTGDGTNDFCPLTKLREEDFAFVREGYSLQRSLKKPENISQLKCKVTYWSDLSVVTSVIAFKDK